MAQSAQDALAGAHAGRVAGCRRGALVEAVAEFVNGLQSQFGRRDSYPVARLEHLKTMTRFPFRMTTASALVLVVMTAAPVALGQALAQESERPFGLFGLFGGSERLSGERAAPSAPADRTAQVSGPDLLVRLERLETQIRQLTGAIEQLQFRNQQLESQIRRMQEEGAPRPATQSRPQNSPPATPPGKRGDAFDPLQNPNAPGAPHTLGSITAPGAAPSMSADPGEQPIGAPGGRAAGTPLDLASMGPPNGPVPGQPPRSGPASSGALATLAPSQTPRDEYDLAYGYVLRKDYALAEDAFRSFLNRYPDDRLVGDATYWLGESMFQRQRYRDSAEAFLTVSTKHESIAKAPDALLRLGQSLAALGEKEAACASLGEVLRKFPRASAAVKQGVEREQKRVRC
jgi:tol-pal system protein YbgF